MRVLTLIAGRATILDLKLARDELLIFQRTFTMLLGPRNRSRIIRITFRRSLWRSAAILSMLTLAATTLNEGGAGNALCARSRLDT